MTIPHDNNILEQQTSPDISNLNPSTSLNNLVSPSIPQIARLINGVHTEVILQAFADKIFIIITQLNRIGTMVRKDRIVLYFPLVYLDNIINSAKK